MTKNLLVLTFGALMVACTGDGKGSVTGPGDVADYARLKSEKDWTDYLAQRETELKAVCAIPEDPDKYYGISCDSDRAPQPKLQKSWNLTNRYVKAGEAAIASKMLSDSARREIARKVSTLKRYNENYSAALKSAPKRRAEQDKIIAKINAEGSCKITRDEASELAELVFTSCAPSASAKNQRVADLLRDLSYASASADAAKASSLSTGFSVAAGAQARLGEIRQQLLDRQIVVQRDGLIHSNQAGHPFGPQANQTALLASYAAEVSASYTRAGGTDGDACAVLGCDRALYELSKAAEPLKVDLLCPQLNVSTTPGEIIRLWVKRTPAPVATDMGLDLDVKSLDLTADAKATTRLTFTKLLPNDVALTIEDGVGGNWCSNPIGAVYLVQEMKRLMSGISNVKNLADLREIRVVNTSYPSDSQLLSATRDYTGIRAVVTLSDKSRVGNIEQMRASLREQLVNQLANLNPPREVGR